tara:strand:+ start:7360 stop:7551 length:192 start_codon:yes stop_codon:yes gene_type:complete
MNQLHNMLRIMRSTGENVNCEQTLVRVTMSGDMTLIYEYNSGKSGRALGAIENFHMRMNLSDT